MSNLLKGNSFVVKEGGKVIIDSNRMAEHILAQRAQIQAENSVAKEENPERVPDEDGFVSGIDATLVEQLLEDEPEPEGPTPEQEAMAAQIVEDAKTEAERIIREAREEAKILLEDSRTKGYEDGYREARAKAEEDINNARNKLEEDYAARKEELERENDEYRASIEPQLVDTLMTVYSQVTRVLADDKKDMIYYLVENVLRNTEMSHEFIIRCSEEDHRFLENNKDKLHGANNPDVRIEIVKDNSLERNQCVIETDSGVFDCSLDIQLDNLRESIHLLSCIQE